MQRAKRMKKKQTKIACFFLWFCCSLIGKEGDSIGAVCFCQTVLVVTAQSRKKGIGKACGACLTVRENGSFSLIFDPTFRGKNITLGSAFERSESCSPSVQVRHWHTSLWAIANLRSMPLADRGSRGNEVPLASNRFAWANCQPKADKGLACLTKGFWKAFGTYGGKNWERRRPFFYGICPNCVQKSFVIFPTRHLCRTRENSSRKVWKLARLSISPTRTDTTK